MDDEKLIEYVRAYNVLYDTYNPKYMDPKYKLKVWEQIGKFLGRTGTQCKSRWTNIRDQYRRHISKRQRNSTGETSRKYKFEEQLQFLLPYVDEKKSTSTSALHTEESSQRIESYEPEENDSNDPETEVQEIATEPLITLSTPDFEVPKRKILKRKNETSMLMKYIIENKAERPQQDDIDVFLASIAITLRKLSAYHQHVAKGKIFKVVHDLEFQSLQNVPSLSTPFPQSSQVPQSPSSFSVESPGNMVTIEGTDDSD